MKTVEQMKCLLSPDRPHLVAKLARETGADTKARDFSSWSHVVRLLHAQLCHGIGLNDICDSLRLQPGQLAAIRGGTPPSRNGVSHANKVLWANDPSSGTRRTGRTACNRDAPAGFAAADS